jgi:phospholipid/cholesterol/gamma-HCH transport system ATP-binding protein
VPSEVLEIDFEEHVPVGLAAWAWAFGAQQYCARTAFAMGIITVAMRDTENKESVEWEAMISLRDLRVSYGEREILHGITFDVKREETLVILGGSGSGKSTLLRTLVGLERPTSGEIWIKGKNIAAISQDEMDEIRKHIGMSFQGSALFGSLTVGENVALPLREHTKLEDSTIEIMLRLKLEQVGLAGYEYYMPSQLSGGMMKRAAVARALAMDPEIIFFDEPSAGLDPIIAAGIDQLILELKKAFRMTIVVVTHELASAFLIADRMVLIDKGNVVAMGTKQEMRDSKQPRVRQFLDRVAEPEVARELDYLQMLTEDRRPVDRPKGKRGT